MDEVKGMMAENIELLLERGQKLEEMDEKVRARGRGRIRGRGRGRKARARLLSDAPTMAHVVRRTGMATACPMVYDTHETTHECRRAR